MKLHYKASNIAKAEAKAGKKFFETFTNIGNGIPAVADLMFLFSAGGGSDDEFDALFEQGIDSVLLAIMEGVNDAGFLGQKLNMTEIKQSMAKAREEVLASQNIGKVAKA